MLEQLFGSKTRLRVLRLLFRFPEKYFFVRELARELGTQINAIRREIELLERSGLIIEVKEAQKSKTAEYGASLRKYFKLNQESLLYPEMKSLVSKIQLLGEEALIKDVQDKGGKIKLFLLTGRFTHDLKAPSDVLIVGDIKERSLTKIFSDYEKELGFEIRFTLMSEAEFKERRHMMDKFLFSLFETENMKVVNELNV